MPQDLGQPSSARQPRKRPRPVISCLRCREKKVKCDRVVPCQNCARAGDAERCEYQHGQGNESKRTRVESECTDRNIEQKSTGVGVIEDLQRRLKHVEDLLGIQQEIAAGSSTSIDLASDGAAATSPSHHTPSTNTRPRRDASRMQTRDEEAPGAAVVVPSASAQRYPGTLVVKGTRTRYHGPTSRISLLQQFTGAKETIGGCTDDNSVFRLAKEVQFLQNKSQLSRGSPESISEFSSIPEFLALRHSLPTRGICDRLVELYTENFEQVFRILHVPTFHQQYLEYWNRDRSMNDQSVHFVPQLTAVLAVAIPLADDKFRHDNSDTCEYLLNYAINLLRSWFCRMPRKLKTEFSTLQTETLTVLAQWLKSDPPEELWRATGSLARSAMVMGLHLNPSNCADFTLFQRETRRRLWTTIVEFELQASIESGMPEHIPYLDSDSLTQFNINDAEYCETSTEFPLVKGFHEWTDSLPQFALVTDLIPRRQAIMHKRQPSLGYELALSDQLEDEYQRMPRCLLPVPAPTSGLPVGPRPSLLNRVILDLCFRRPLACLYRSILQHSNGDHEHCTPVREKLLDLSYEVLSYQLLFENSLVGSNSDSEESPEVRHLLQRLTKNDMIRAALNVCGYMKLAPTPWSKKYSRADLVDQVEYTIRVLTRHLHRPGTDVKDIILLTVALHQSHPQASSEDQRSRARERIQQVLWQCRQHLLSYSANKIGLQDPRFVRQNPSNESLEDYYYLKDVEDPCTSLIDIAQSWGGDPAIETDLNTLMADPLWLESGDYGGFFA
ncbi:Zn(II)2Cys6 transcription factor [Aspergillus undulatus]|uniref:Zn(II)2Cys6 transcription factor n=1 Tax=Aspergillus undulatus TaxID=1810928 RepID=UPI003CCE510C